jgi:protein-glucosylgalactosylhydroxylysine glucosidase
MPFICLSLCGLLTYRFTTIQIGTPVVKIILRFVFVSFGLILLLRCSTPSSNNALIDRNALVTRHNVVLKAVDTLGSLSVGNGEFAFTVDASGLQTFYKEYENGISLGTQSQWGWHSIPSNEKYTVDDVARLYESCDSTKAPHAVQQSEGRAGEATKVLRANPHRLHLGLIGLVLLKENGEEIKLSDLKNINQHLDLWTGRIESNYEIEGIPVKVILYGHQQQDRIAVHIESPLIEKERIKIKMDFPYGKDCHVCPGYDFESSAKHHSTLVVNDEHSASIKRELDSTTYFVHVDWKNSIEIQEIKKHQFLLNPAKEKSLEFSVEFSREDKRVQTDFPATKKNSIQHWAKFWTSGGAVDFSDCTDPRAKELERRVVLSQYLTKIQCAGSLPPQETGLIMNSWFGKFHLEMHWWHAAQFALWNRADLLEKSMPWYSAVTPKAKATAQWQGYEGARWQKMTDPFGNESPSSVGAFIIWQQPHPIYFAEQLYRNDPSEATLEKYKDMVFNTADFMASFVKLKDGKYHLCHPLIPAQEIFKATETDNPAYELQYWYYGLTTAQEWRRRLGLEENKKWKDVIENLAPLAVSNTLYLPNSTTPNAYVDDQYRRDHPAVVGAYGFLPFNSRIDSVIMRNTFKEIMNHWQWETTWGWDYPLLAMTAARLNKPEQAISALLMDVQKNTYLVNGHNYQDERLRLYLPGNGGTLAVVAMMCAGWDGNEITNPGFPKDGKWNVKWEGLKRMQ